MLAMFVSMLLIAAPPDADPALAPFFKNLTKPNSIERCCDISDCRIVPMKTVGNIYYVWIAKGNNMQSFIDGVDGWVEVPNNAIIRDKTNPTGGAVVCWTKHRGIIYFLPPIVV